MPIDASAAGRTYPPTAPHRVTADEVDAFVRALGGDPVPGAAAPVTFAMKLAAPAWQSMFADEELGLALERTVHTDQAFDVVRPIAVGDEVAAQLTIEKVRPRGDADFVTVVVDLASGAEPLVRCTSTFLCTRAVAA